MKLFSRRETHVNVREASFAIACLSPIELELDPPATTNCEAPALLKTFSIGGVHPHENKLSAHQPIITAEVPAKAVILLGQHIGAPAKPVVAKGDVVTVGTKIAEPAGFVSAAIHSSVSGKVAKIDTIVDASGYAKPAIFIDVECDEWEEAIDRR